MGRNGTVAAVTAEQTSKPRTNSRPVTLQLRRSVTAASVTLTAAAGLLVAAPIVGYAAARTPFADIALFATMTPVAPALLAVAGVGTVWLSGHRSHRSAAIAVAAAVAGVASVFGLLSVVAAYTALTRTAYSPAPELAPMPIGLSQRLTATMPPTAGLLLSGAALVAAAAVFTLSSRQPSKRAGSERTGRPT